MKNFIHKIIAIVITIIVSLSQVSCLKEDIKTSNGKVNSFRDITVPRSFNFATTRNVDMHLSLVHSGATNGYGYVARIYDKAPEKGGRILVSGALDNTSYSYNQVLNLPTYQAEVYMKVYLGSEPIYATSINVTSNTISAVIPLDAAANNIHLIAKDRKDEDSDTVSFKIAESEWSPGFGKDNDINDNDSDGIVNELDDFPDDSERAFLNTIGTGTLLFEDLWPNLGDYDFNDLVIGYQYFNILNAKNKIIGLQANFKVLAIGAGLDNGFGFSLPVTNSQIKSVTGYSRVNSNTNLNLNGTEAGHSNESVIIVYDNLSSVGEMINVYKGSNSKNTDEIKIDIAFKGDVNFSKNQINPFIYLNQDRAKEVHLAGYTPTNEANTSYFGLADDNSGCTYYTSNEGLPWALDVPASISYMQEGNDFIKGYPDFVNWVETRGAENKNWHLTNITQEVLY